MKFGRRKRALLGVLLLLGGASALGCLPVEARVVAAVALLLGPATSLPGVA